MNYIQLHKFNNKRDESWYYFDSIQDNIVVSYAAFITSVKINASTAFAVIGKPGLVRLSEGLHAERCDESFFGKHDYGTSIVCYEPRVISAVILSEYILEEKILTEQEIDSVINPVLSEKDAIELLKKINCYHSERIWKIYDDPEHRAPITKFIPKVINERVKSVLKARNK